MSVDAPRFHTPDHIGHRVNNALARAGKHWKSLTLTVAALGGLTYGAILMARPGVDDVQSKEPIKASDPYKAPENGLGQVVVPINTPEAIPTTPPSSPTPQGETAAGSGPDPDPTKKPTQVSASPTAESTKVVPDTKPTQPPATATPEKREVVPCIIVPQKFCSEGEVIRTEDRLGHPETYIGFDLPKGTSISTDRYGQTLKGEIGQPNAFKGSVIIMANPDLKNITARSLEVKGDIGFEDTISRNVPEGTVITSVQGRGIKNFGKDVLITVKYLDPKLGYGVPDEEYLRTKFSEAFEKPAKYYPYSGPEEPGKTVLSPLFGKQ